MQEELNVELMQYALKLEKAILNKRSQITRERRKFQQIVQKQRKRECDYQNFSLSKYLDQSGISCSVVGSFLDELPTQIDSEDEFDEQLQKIKRIEPLKPVRKQDKNLRLFALLIRQLESNNIIRIPKQEIVTKVLKPLLPTTPIIQLQLQQYQNSTKTIREQSIPKTQTQSNQESSQQDRQKRKYTKKQDLNGVEPPKRKRRTKAEMEEARKMMEERQIIPSIAQ